MNHLSQSEYKELLNELIKRYEELRHCLDSRTPKDKFKLKLGRRWFWKPQEFLDNMLEELRITYGLYY